MSIKPPGLVLSLCSLLWIGAGVLGLPYFASRGNWVMACATGGLGLLAMGLWFQWSVVRWPLVVYWTIVGALGLVGASLGALTPSQTVRAIGAFAFAWLVIRWEP